MVAARSSAGLLRNGSMTDRFGQESTDEPVIGATYEPGALRPGEAAFDSYDDDYPETPQQWSDEYDYYDDEVPARQPMFYVFIALAAVLGGLFIFLVYSLFRNDEKEIPAGSSTQAAGFQVRINVPIANERIESGRDTDVVVEATSTDAIVKFELFRDKTTVAQAAAGQPDANRVYRSTLKLRLDRKGEYKIFVRVTSQSGATQDSAVVNVIAVEPIGEKPTSIRGRVVAVVNLRSGPGEQFEAVGQLQANTEVKIIGKTRDNQWLLVEIDGGRWVKSAAIDPLDSLALVPVKEPTPTVAPPTNTPLPRPSPSPSPSASPSATVAANAPDLAPQNASLIDGGARLRITIANLSVNSFEGPVVVSAGGVGSGTLTQVFNLRIPANNSVTVDFEINPPVTTQKSAQIRVDPDNAIRETNEDNNGATFILAAPIEQPVIVITSVDVSGTSVIVSIRNTGGPLAASDVTVKVTINQSGAEQTKNIALSKDNPPVTFTIPKPNAGSGKVEVLIKGQVVASAQLTIP